MPMKKRERRQFVRAMVAIENLEKRSDAMTKSERNLLLSSQLIVERYNKKLREEQLKKLREEHLDLSSCTSTGATSSKDDKVTDTAAPTLKECEEHLKKKASNLSPCTRTSATSKDD